MLKERDIFRTLAKRACPFKREQNSLPKIFFAANVFYLKLPIEGVREKDRAIRARVNRPHGNAQLGKADLSARNASIEVRVSYIPLQSKARYFNVAVGHG